MSRRHPSPPRRAARSLSRACTWAWLAAACASCSRPAPPSWIPLADERATRVSPAEPRFATTADRAVTLVERDGWPYLSTRVLREEWTLRDELGPGTWVCELSAFETRPLGAAPPGAPAASAADVPSQRLTAGERAFAQKPVDGRELAPGSFQAVPGGMFLRLAPGEEPPAETTFELHALREVVSAAGTPAARRHVRGTRYAGDGFALWAGERCERQLDLPQQSVLRFATAVEPVLLERGGALIPVRFTVELDGKAIFTHEVPDASFASHAWHTVELPEDGARGARLAFRVEGGLAYAAFLAPVVGPRSVGGFGDRPWRAARPDIVLFVADTFRADNLRAYGGELGLTPTLDALAERALVFANAYSVGTYTLPVHAAMFAGVYPHQANVVSARHALRPEWTTLAEQLSAHGYRTGAVTESLMVSQIYGLEQGFEWWDEQQVGLEATLRGVRSFLDADDGRPTFLLVHTYRTHLPYRISERTRAELGGRLDLVGDWNAFEQEMQALARAGAGPETLERVRALTATIRDHYRATARDLDLEIEGFLADLDRRGLDESGWLAFTSDHGEAFYEHDALYHECKVWEEVVRVPLLVTGPGVSARTVATPVSLIDLAPTLADMAGVPAHPAWVGRSLLAPELEPRPVFLFECDPAPDATLGVIEGGHKVMGFEEVEALRARRLFAAFDLASDPHERHDLSAAGASWPLEQLGRHAEAAEVWLTPQVDAQRAAVGAQRVQELRDVGYAGEDE